MNVRCWIVCRPCSDPYYNGHPTGMVFDDEAKAKEYIEHANGPRSEGDTGEHDLYLQKGCLER